MSLGTGEELWYHTGLDPPFPLRFRVASELQSQPATRHDAIQDNRSLAKMGMAQYLNSRPRPAMSCYVRARRHLHAHRLVWRCRHRLGSSASVGAH